jgi:uncharacterized membrane protein YdbT with pleckstrin-like domain
MAKKSRWREGEEHVISVTPVGWGLWAPALATVLACVLVWLGVTHVHVFDEYRVALAAVLVLPCLGILATRTWRWRSHKIHLTSQRIIVEGGVLQHSRSEVELHDLVKTRVSQRLRDRLARRGVIVVETPAGILNLGMVRHPAALCRLIDNERRTYLVDDVAYDTVFDFDAPQDHDFDMSDRRHRGQRP